VLSVGTPFSLIHIQAQVYRRVWFENLGAFFAAPSDPAGLGRKKPGYPLQFLTNRFAVCSGISASIPCAEDPEGQQVRDRWGPQKSFNSPTMKAGRYIFGEMIGYAALFYFYGGEGNCPPAYSFLLQASGPSFLLTRPPWRVTRRNLAVSSGRKKVSIPLRWWRGVTFFGLD
jgi:hypothetical protein